MSSSDYPVYLLSDEQLGEYRKLSEHQKAIWTAKGACRITVYVEVNDMLHLLDEVIAHRAREARACERCRHWDNDEPEVPPWCRVHAEYVVCTGGTCEAWEGVDDAN